MLIRCRADVTKAMAKRETEKEAADARFYTANRDADAAMYKKTKEVEAACKLETPGYKSALFFGLTQISYNQISRPPERQRPITLLEKRRPRPILSLVSSRQKVSVLLPRVMENCPWRLEAATVFSSISCSRRVHTERWLVQTQRLSRACNQRLVI